jgi:predicted nuclease with TOPRIM domain
MEAQTVDANDRKKIDEIWAILNETSRKFEQEMESYEKIKERQDRLDRRIDKVGKQIGELHNRFGELAEHLVAPNIAARFDSLGYNFDRIATKGMEIAENGKIKVEVDIFLENRDCVMAVEVKSKPKEKDVEHHIKRLEIIREQWDKRGDSRKIQGAIAGAIFPTDIKKAAVDSGLFVLVQSGDTIKLEIPDGFVPREW